MKAFVKDVQHVLEKLWKLLIVERPQCVTDGVQTALQMFALMQVIFLGVLVAQTVWLLCTKKWKRAAIFAATAVCVALFRFAAYPALIARIPYFV